MEKEFVSYEQAVALKELGACFTSIAWYLPNNPMLILHPAYMTAVDILAPLKQQVFRWFREKYGYYIDFIVFNKKDNTLPITKNDDCLFSYIIYRAYDNEFSSYDDENPDENFQTVWDYYEEVEEEAINQMIKLAKEQEK